MTREYTPISFDKRHQYLELLNRNKSQASDYCFANLWGWAPYYGLEWSFDEALCWIRQTEHTPCYWAPVGDWSAIADWAKIPEMQQGSHFIRVPEALCDIWQKSLPDNIRREEARGQWDYLYLSSELATLSGNRFHKKKNLVNQFERRYEYIYEALTESGVETVVDLQHEWCKWRDCEDSKTLLAENEAVERVLAKYTEIPGLCGGIIRIDGEPMAYTLAEPLHDDTLVVHFEKACNTLKGGYQAINYLFCNDIGVDYTYINREQDLDEEGLRKAKESYNPVGFAKKCEVFVE